MLKHISIQIEGLSAMDAEGENVTHKNHLGNLVSMRYVIVLKSQGPKKTQCQHRKAAKECYENGSREEAHAPSTV